MVTTQRIRPCLWFADEAEDAARFYTGIFKRSRITAITRYSEAGSETHHRPAGSVMVVAFDLDGQSFTALNGGPVFTFNEAVSLQVNCETQEEIDYYRDKLSAGGDPKAQQCGWRTAGDASDAADEEARHRRVAPGVRRRRVSW